MFEQIPPQLADFALQTGYNWISNENGDILSWLNSPAVNFSDEELQSVSALAVKSFTETENSFKLDGEGVIQLHKIKSEGSIYFLLKVLLPGKIKSESNLKSAEETLFSKILENLTGVVTVCDPLGEINYQSDSVSDILGFTKDEVLGTNVFKYIWPEDTAIAAEKWSDLISKPSSIVKARLRLLNAESKPVPVEITAKNLSKDNTVQGILLSYIDLTEEIKTQNELKKLQNFINLIQKISVSFINLPTEELKKQINELLKMIAEFFGINSGIVFRADFINHLYRPDFIWISEETSVSFRIKPVSFSVFAADDSFIRTGKPVICDNINTLPDGPKTAGKEILRTYGVRSFAHIALTDPDSKRIFGFLGLYSSSKFIEWPDYTGELLVMVSQIVSASLMRIERAEHLKMLSGVIQLNPSPVLILRSGLQVSYLNASFSNKFGVALRTGGELLFEDLLNRIASPEETRKIVRGINEEKTYKTEVILKTVEKKDKWFECSFSRIYHSDDADPDIILIFMEIDDIKELQGRIRSSEETLNLIAKAGTLVFYRLKFASRDYDYINPAISDLIGYSPEEIRKIGFGSIVIQSQNIKKDGVDEGSPVAARGLFTEYEADYLVKTKSGEEKWLNDKSFPWYDKAGNFMGSQGILTDITFRKQAELEIIAARNKAEELNLLKSNFLASMSHELRTPLIGILGYAEIMSMENNDSDTGRMASTIFKSGKRLLNSLNMILDLSKLEAGKLELSLSLISLSKIAAEITDLFRIAAENKGLEFITHFPESDIMIETDEKILHDILNNIVSNAIKYTPAGSVTLYFIPEGNEFFITVQDTGIGIDKSNIDLIFEEFRQVSEGYSRRYEGTGLGLTLTRRFVKLLSGEITVESTLNKGTAFTLRFPVKQTGGEINPPPAKY
ncbi:MAG: PAS domain S-box protein [Ignavibacteriaceae bacterium]|nr:PAS domain S-box protein [Ignavibacteriaceae bacterium]